MHFTKWIGPKCVSLIITNKKIFYKIPWYFYIVISIWNIYDHWSHIISWYGHILLTPQVFIFIVRLMLYLVSMIFHKSLPVQKKSSTICLVREMNTMRPYLTIQHSVTTWYWCKQHEYVNFSLNLYLSWCYLTW